MRVFVCRSSPGAQVVLALLLTAAGAGQLPGEPLARPSPMGGHTFTILEHETPRVVVAGRDGLVVRVRVRNDGHTVWEPGERFALSYHWLTRSGRVIVVDGARTWVTTAVAPGETAVIDGELCAPPSTGLFVLQWDMVEEGVTWFSKADPRPPMRLWVVALPGASAVVAGLVPLTVAWAVAGGAWLAWAAWRRRRVALPADLTWCGLSLFTKQLWLMVAMHVPVSLSAVLAIATSAVVPAAGLNLLPPGRLRAGLAWAVAALGTLLVAADAVHFRYFGDVLSAGSLKAVPQAPRLWSSVAFLLSWRDSWLVFDLLAAVALVLATPREPAAPVAPWRRRALATVAFAAAVVPAAVGPVRAVSADDARGLVFRHLNVVEEAGPFGYHAADVVSYVRRGLLQPPLSSEDIQAADRWFTERAGWRAGVGPTFGAARGRSLVMILGESLQGFVVGLRVGGQEITPTLNRLLPESLWTLRLVDQAGEGRTSDAELVNAVSLLPLTHGAAAFQYPANGFVPLPRVLTARGYRTVSAVPFEASFWNRRVTHAAYGFERSYFAPDFAPGPQVGWGLNDRDFLRQMVPRLVAGPKPFYAWLITLSLHHPFDEFPAEMSALDLGEWNGTRVGNYLQAMHLLDAGIGEFLDGLRRARVLDDTVVVIQGDHEAGLPSRDVARLGGFRTDEVDGFLADSVPLIVRLPGAESPRGEIHVPAGQVDVPPTLLALLGVDPASLPYIGRNLLTNPADSPILRRYGDWIDARHLYLASQASGSSPRCIDRSSRTRVPLEACSDGVRAADRLRRTSWQVLTYGLQHRLARGLEF